VDHRAFLIGLPAPRRRRLSARTNATGARHLCVHGGALALTGTLIARRSRGWPLLLPVHGVLLVFLFTLVHECTHRTPFRWRWPNQLCGRIGGFALVLPFEWFRWFHLAHHRHTNDPVRDPELAVPRPATLRAWRWYVSGGPYWLSQARLVVRLARRRERAGFLPDAARPAAEREARVMLAGYAIAAASLARSPGVLWIWIVPAVIGQPFLRWYLAAEHGDRPHVVDVFVNTRTMSTNAAMRFLAWNMPYHTEHHVFPGVPFHQLPELHRAMRAELIDADEGYVAFTRRRRRERRQRVGRAPSLS
jgi:fatty acid desaturase